MPAHHWVAYLFAATTVAGAGSAAVYTALAPQPEPVEHQNVAASSPGVALVPAQKAAPASSPAPVVNESAAPSFDVVRIERNGDGVIAGRAEPGWKVIIASNDDEIAHAVADRNGEWAVVLEKPLPPGEHLVGLRAFAPAGNRGLVSDQEVAVSIARPKAPERTVVALSQPGSATRVLTQPEQEQAPGQGDAPGKAAPEQPREESARAETPGPQAGLPIPEPASNVVPPTATAGRLKPPRETGPASQAGFDRGITVAVPETVVSFDAVDYELNNDGKGTLFLSGQADAGTRIKLYLDNNRVGEAVAAADGTWTFESLRTLPSKKRHTMRADAVQSDGQVASRAEVPFTPPALPSPLSPQPKIAAMPDPAKSAPREIAQRAASPEPGTESIESRPAVLPAPPAPKADTPAPETDMTASAPAGNTAKPESAVVAAAKPATAAKPQPAVVAAAEPAVTAEPHPAVAAAAEPAQTPAAGTVVKLRQKRSIVVRRGDTLWHIARRRYGYGIRYTAIYRNNRDQIRNPHLIYPGQEFQLPVQ